MALLRALVCLSFLVLTLVGPASAATYEDGLRAYDAGRTTEALALWRTLAQRGDAQAKYGIGKIYDTGGQGVPRNYTEAARWYEEAAKEGVAAAGNNLALLYAEGLGVQQDKAKAAELWKQAAEGGHREAQYNYALSLYRGSGVSRDPSAAAKWFRYAAQQGLPEAQFAVGEMYLIGIGLPKDPGLALAWYRRAEAQGHSAAAAQAGQLAQSGVAVKQPEFLPPLETAVAAGRPTTLPPQVQDGAGKTAAVPAAEAKAAAPGQPTQLLPAEAQKAPPEAAARPPLPEVLRSTETAAAPAAAVEAPPAEVTPEVEAQSAVAEPETTVAAQEASAAPLPPASREPAPAEPKPGAAPTPAEAAPAAEAAKPETGETTALAAISATRPGDSGSGDGSLAPPPSSWSLWLLSAATETEAKALAETLMGRYRSLADLPLQVQQAKAGERTYFRAFAGSWPAAEEARRLCRALREEDPDAFCSPVERN